MPLVSDFVEWGYGNPDAPGYAADHIVSFHAGGITLTCRRELVPIFTALIEGIEATGYEFETGVHDDWGYVNKGIEGYGPEHKSWHSVGGAIDLDATKNPMGQPKTTFPVRKTQTLVKDLGLTWGYNWKSTRPDPMHFEAGHPLAQMEAIAHALRKDLKEPDPTPLPYKRSLSMGDKGADVRWVQKRLHALDYWTGDLDGRYNYALALAVRQYQQARGMTVTGDVNRHTWNALAG